MSYYAIVTLRQYALLVSDRRRTIHDPKANRTSLDDSTPKVWRVNPTTYAACSGFLPLMEIDGVRAFRSELGQSPVYPHELERLLPKCQEGLQRWFDQYCRQIKEQFNGTPPDPFPPPTTPALCGVDAEEKPFTLFLPSHMGFPPLYERGRVGVVVANPPPPDPLAPVLPKLLKTASAGGLITDEQEQLRWYMHELPAIIRYAATLSDSVSSNGDLVVISASGAKHLEFDAEGRLRPLRSRRRWFRFLKFLRRHD